MDEKLKNQIMISLIPGGLVLVILQLIFNMQGNSVFWWIMAPLLGILVAGATFGIVFLMQKD